MKKFLLFAGLAGLLISAASARTATPVIRKRQATQEHRIDRGVRTGALTPRETGRLEAREARIQQDKQAAKSDGVVTAGERRHLRREETRSSKAIYRQKHDRQVTH